MYIPKKYIQTISHFGLSALYALQTFYIGFLPMLSHYDLSGQ